MRLKITLTRYKDTNKMASSDTTNVDYANHQRSNIYTMDPVEASTEYDKYKNRLYGMCERRIYLYFRGFSAVNLGYNHKLHISRMMFQNIPNKIGFYYFPFQMKQILLTSKISTHFMVCSSNDYFTK